jgi:hypothetical protein
MRRPMAGAEEGGKRYVLEGAVVYLHVVQRSGSGESLVHIDVEHPDLNEIIVPKESSYVGGKDGGLFIGLRLDQAKRAEDFLQGRLE